MRIIKDVIGDVNKDGARIHHNVRIMVNDQGRVAVFDGKAKKPPDAVYAKDEVTFTVTGGCSPCKGYAPRMSMMRLWDQTERSNV